MRRPKRSELTNTGRFNLEELKPEEGLSVAAAGLDLQPENNRSKLKLEAPTRTPKASKLRASAKVKELRPKIDVFDKLSKTLESHAVELMEEDVRREALLRPQIVKCLREVSTDEAKLGELLFGYRVVYKSGRQWTQIAEEIGKMLKRSSRTIYRLVEKHEASLQPGPKEKTPRNTSDMSRQEHLEIEARHAIRSFLNDVPKTDKPALLSKMLAEEAFQVWGWKEPAQLVIEPTPSRFTVDGRKRAPAAGPEEAEA